MPESRVPENLRSYQNDDTKVVLYWGLPIDVYDIGATGPTGSTGVDSYTWEITTDLVDTFDSTNKRTYYATGVTGATGPGYIDPSLYIKGGSFRGISVDPYTKLEGQSLRMYWRVRATKTPNVWGWASDYYDIPESVVTATRSSMLSFLPDAVYDKGSDTAVYKIHDALDQEFENANKTLTAVNNDLYIKSARDAVLEANFAMTIGIGRPDWMNILDYREVLRAFMGSIRKAPAKIAILNLVYTIYRQNPTFVRMVDEYGIYQNSAATVSAGLPDSYVYDPSYPASTLDAYVLDNRNLSWGIIIEVQDLPTYDAALIRDYIYQIISTMVQVHVPIYMRSV